MPVENRRRAHEQAASASPSSGPRRLQLPTPGTAGSTLTTVGLPLLISWLTSWKMLLQSMDLSSEPRFTITATANRICSRTYFWRLQNTKTKLRLYIHLIRNAPKFLPAPDAPNSMLTPEYSVACW